MEAVRPEPEGAANAGPAEGNAAATGADRGRYHHGNLREALLDAATELIARHGIPGFSLNAAARAAGVSTAAPYRHFASRDALLAAVVERGWEQFGTALRQTSLRHPDDPLARLAALGHAYIDFAATRPAMFRLLFGERKGGPLTSVAGPATFATLLDCVREARRQGLIRPDPDDQRIAQTAWAMVHGVAVLHLDNLVTAIDRSVTAPQLGRTAVELLINGLRLRPPSGAG